MNQHMQLLVISVFSAASMAAALPKFLKGGEDVGRGFQCATSVLGESSSKTCSTGKQTSTASTSTSSGDTFTTKRAHRP